MQYMTRDQRALTDVPPEAIEDPEHSAADARTPAPTQEGLSHDHRRRAQAQHTGPAAVADQQFLSSAKRGIGQSGIFIAFLAILALFAILTKGTILTPQNISNLVVQNTYILILAIGMVIVIIAGHIDLSVGSVVGFTGALAGVFMVNLGLPGAGWACCWSSGSAPSSAPGRATGSRTSASRPSSSPSPGC